MSRLFITVLNMSLTASYVALVVIIIRMLFGKSPKIFSYILWAIVWFRLVCPVSFESPLSLVPIKSPIPYDITTSTNPMVRFGLRSVDNILNQSIKSSVPNVNPAASVNSMGIVMEIAAVIWLLGIAVILCYSIVSYFRLKIRLSTATLFKDNIFETDRIKTPFVLGFIRPKIFIPTELAQKELDYILKHEQVHIKRKDYIIKPMAFLAVVLHWFNPLVWLCYFLMSKDMEMSCDESVIKQSREDIRASYSHSLLSLSAKQSGFLIPLAFGESNIKSRIKNVLNYKKPVFWIVFIAVVLVIVVSIALMANPLDGAGFLNTHGKGFSIAFFNPFDSLTEAEKFLKYKTDYVGDAPKVAGIIYLLDFPEKVNYDHFELHTDSTPYAVTVHLKTDTQTRNYYTGALHQAPFKKNAIIMFSLIGNVDYINFNLTDGENDYLVQYTKDGADMTAGKDVREFSQEKRKFARLLKTIDDKAENFIKDYYKKHPVSSVDKITELYKRRTSVVDPYKADESDQITNFAWEVINRDIAYYEENPEVKIIDSKITKLKLLESFDTLAEMPIDVYALEYRLLPEDLSKVVLAGGMDVDEDGWLKETCSMGSPLLVVSRSNSSAELKGILWTGEVSGKELETSVKELLERNQEK
ncbi:MAG: M56 family metallopeptidase [Tepidanaerobacteraceae bacterium]|nr:M56 family metallopeptidase [Tepidanaerobacteraceae bacterium]